MNKERPAKPSDWKAFESKLGIVRLILSVMWDPLSVFGYRNTLAEYDRYASQVLEYAESNPDEEKLSVFLLELEMKRMGPWKGMSQEPRVDVAKKILWALTKFEN